jgi:hypothetical protein
MKLFDAVRANQYSLLVVTTGPSESPMFDSRGSRLPNAVNCAYIQHSNVTQILTGQTPSEADDVYNTYQPLREQFDKFHKQYDEDTDERTIGRHSRYTLFVSVETLSNYAGHEHVSNNDIFPLVYELLNSPDKERLLTIVLEEVPLHVETIPRKSHERCIHVPYHPTPKTISEANKYTKKIMDKVSKKVDVWLRENGR